MLRLPLQSLLLLCVLILVCPLLRLNVAGLCFLLILFLFFGSLWFTCLILPFFDHPTPFGLQMPLEKRFSVGLEGLSPRSLFHRTIHRVFFCRIAPQDSSPKNKAWESLVISPASLRFKVKLWLLNLLGGLPFTRFESLIRCSGFYTPVYTSSPASCHPT